MTSRTRGRGPFVALSDTAPPLSLATSEDGRALLPRRDLAASAVPVADPAPIVERVEVAEVEPLDLSALAERVAEHLDLGRSLAGRGVHPLASFASLADYARAARAGDPAAVALAIVDQVTTDNPGVIPPAWLSQVQGIVNLGARAIATFGGSASIGDEGMSLTWPYFDGDLATIIGEQVAEKDLVTSVKVSLKKGSADLGTFAGGSDVSWQLIERSAPSYLEAYLRILAAAYAVVTDQRFCADLVTAGVGEGPLTTTSADAVRSALFAASLETEKATGAPASSVIAASDVFRTLGGLAGLVPTPYGTQNVSGTATASTLRVEVSGLEVVHAPGLAAGHLIVGNPSAARWHGSGPLVASADDVTKLGRDVVTWGMGATAPYVPAGVRVFGKAKPTATK